MNDDYVAFSLSPFLFVRDDDVMVVNAVVLFPSLPVRMYFTMTWIRLLCSCLLCLLLHILLNFESVDFFYAHFLLL